MRTAALLCLVACAGCGPDELPPFGQVLLFVDTDAPLPPPPGQALGPDDPAALFDAARVDVFSPDGSCAPCSHEFAVDRERIGVGASLGILPRPATAGYVARVRLFRAALVKSGEPRADSTIDVTVSLPEVVEGQIEELTVLLRTDDVGQQLGQAAPLQPEPGRPTAPRVGSWPGARRDDCGVEPSEDEVCVPGGAFWMGNPSITTSQLSEPADRQRLVIVEPFFLDKTEVTVAAFRASGLAVVEDPQISPGSAGAELADWCTYTAAPGGLDQLPVNCVSWLKAREFCQLQGKDLPREAGYEYAAGALRSSDYVWGTDDPSCDQAVFGRVGEGAALEAAASPCRPPEGIGGSLPPGSGTRDALALPTGAILDLAGNVREHVLDVWNAQYEACWSGTVLDDPICEQPGTVTAAHAVRGGSWLDLRRRLLAASRGFLDESTTNAAIGFRCARRP